MYCSSCGKEIAENMKFCTQCGASVAPAAAPPVQQPVQQAPVQPVQQAAQQVPVEQPQQAYVPPQQIAPVQPVVAPSVTYSQAEAISPAKRRKTHAIAAACAVLLMVTMLFSWIVISVPLAQMDDMEEYAMYMGNTDLSITISPFTIAGAAGQVNKVLKIATASYAGYGSGYGYGYMNEEFEQMKAAESGLSALNIGLTIVNVLVVLSVLSLIVFVFLLFGGNKKAALMGQLGNFLAVIAGVIFIIVALVVSSKIDSFIMLMRGPVGIVKFSSTLWVYATVVLGVIGGAFVTTKKSILQQI